MKSVRVQKYGQSASANKEKVTKRYRTTRRVPPKFIDPREGQRRRIQRQEEQGISFSI